MTSRELQHCLEQVIFGTGSEIRMALWRLNAEFGEFAEVTASLRLDGCRDIRVVVTKPFPPSTFQSFVDDDTKSTIGHIPITLMQYSSQVERLYNDGSRYVVKSRYEERGHHPPQ